ncbi:MAG: serine protease [Candidatus Aminicenantes bacterium]|jgi:S1-C subfamily serine protease
MSDFFDHDDSEKAEEKEKNRQNQLLLGGFLGLVLLVLLIIIIIGETSQPGKYQKKPGQQLEEIRRRKVNVDFPHKRKQPGNITIPEARRSEGVGQTGAQSIKAQSQRHQTQVLFSVVRVITENTSGSGTLLSREGYFLTNYHVVKDSRVQLILFSKDPRKSPEKYFFTKILSRDNNLDLAVLQIVSPIEGASMNDLTPIRLGLSSSLKIDDEIRIYGYPGVGGDTITSTRGVISGFWEDYPYWIKTDAIISSGNSGGGAFNLKGEFIGVPTAGAVDSRMGSQIGMIMPVDSIKKYISSYL